MQRFWGIPMTMETPIVFPKPNQKPRCLAIAGPGVVGDPLMLLERLSGKPAGASYGLKQRSFG